MANLKRLICGRSSYGSKLITLFLVISVVYLVIEDLDKEPGQLQNDNLTIPQEVSNENKKIKFVDKKISKYSLLEQ